MTKPELRPTRWYVVVHQFPMSETRTDYDTCSMLHETFERAENALAYCQAMQERRHPGSEGRYFIASVTEATGAEGDDQ